MGKVFDVDEYLKEKAVTVKLNGKSFEVKDVPYEVRDKFDSEDENKQLEGLRILLGCTEKDLEGYGYAATSAIIEHITQNLFQSPSQEDQ